MMDELEKLVQFMNRFPALAEAFTSTQSTFDDQAEPTDDDLLFVTRIIDAPVVVEGRLAPDGIWRISRCHLSVDPEHEGAVEEAIAKEADDEMLVLRDGVGEAMVRWAIPRILANLTPSEARDAFLRRLAHSRFGAAATRH
jgi:hypothetical protein